MHSLIPVSYTHLDVYKRQGLSTQENDVRAFGMAKEGLIARQFMLGVVQTAEGLPIYHEVFDGNTAETKTLLPMLKIVLNRFPLVSRLVSVSYTHLSPPTSTPAFRPCRSGKTATRSQAARRCVCSQ